MPPQASTATFPPVDLRTRTSLFCGVLAIAIAVSIVLRGRTQRQQWLFAAFAADVGLWYLAQWLYRWSDDEVWVRITAVLAVLLPQLALGLFESIVPREERRPALLRVAGLLMIPMLLLALSPQHAHGIARGTLFLYVFGLLAAGLGSLAFRGQRSRSRATQRRVRLLVTIGALAVAFSLADFLWFIGAPLPPVGAVLSIVFLFALAESMMRERLVDLYDVLGHLIVSTALAFCIAGIFYVFVVLFGGFETMYLGAILAAIVILVLFEPLREKVERYIHGAFFRERLDLERAVTQARRQLLHVLQVDELLQVVISTLEDSRRVTGAALYLRDPSRFLFELGAFFGRAAPSSVDYATARPLIERLTDTASVNLEDIEVELAERKRRGWAKEMEADERLLAAAAVLGPYRKGVCLAIHGEAHELLGLLVLIDDRVTDAFSLDDVAMLESLAVQIGVVVENSRQYRRMQVRDRLAALGQMAAGLAHEVKNPLGAIKGAAQLLAEPSDGAAADAASQEFVQIILEEVERLDRVVGSVLDYARPSKGNPALQDVNAIVRRTLQVLAPVQGEEISVKTELGDGLPRVRVDAEQLRQVLINLVGNATQAMAGAGCVTVITRGRYESRSGTGDEPVVPPWVEVVVQDQGPGIEPKVLQNLFVPFFTTKDHGTGLGLAISQRMVEEMGGRIEVVSSPGAGASFVVSLPAARDPVAAARQSLAPVDSVGTEFSPREPAS